MEERTNPYDDLINHELPPLYRDGNKQILIAIKGESEHDTKQTLFTGLNNKETRGNLLSIRKQKTVDVLTTHWTKVGKYEIYKGDDRKLKREVKDIRRKSDVTTI